jgi:hypothetical protein
VAVPGKTKKTLTTKFVDNLKKAPQGRREHYWDATLPCFGVRVTDRGRKTYIVYTRWPGGAEKPARRRIGRADLIDLAEARNIARSWLADVERGVDPAERE